MATYSTYRYYVDTFHGRKLSEADFNEYSVRAQAFIDQVTFGRLLTIAKKWKTKDCVKKCECALAEYIPALEKADDKAVAGDLNSESVGSYSVSYKSGVDMADNANRRMYSICEQYLSNTGLLYRGVMI